MLSWLFKQLNANGDDHATDKQSERVSFSGYYTPDGSDEMYVDESTDKDTESFRTRPLPGGTPAAKMSRSVN